MMLTVVSNLQVVYLFDHTCQIQADLVLLLAKNTQLCRIKASHQYVVNCLLGGVRHGTVNWAERKREVVSEGKECEREREREGGRENGAVREREARDNERQTKEWGDKE